MIVLVCGGRDYDNEERVAEVLEEVAEWSAGKLTIVQGGARGADSEAARWGREHGHEVVTVHANWKVHGKAAGPIRNRKMLEEYQPDQAVVFPGGPGTRDMLIRLFEAGVNTWVVGK